MPSWYQAGNERFRGAVFTSAVVVAPTTTWDPLKKNAQVVLNGTKLVASHPAVATWATVLAVAGATTGKKYWEYIIAEPNAQAFAGMANTTADLTANIGAAAPGADSLGVGPDGKVNVNAITLTTVHITSNGDTVALAVDIGAKLFWHKNLTAGGGWNNTGADPGAGTGGIDISSINAGPYFAAGTVSNTAGADTMTANFGGSAYAGAVPSGFGNW